MPNAITNTLPMCDDTNEIIYKDCLGCWDLHITHIEGTTWQEKLDTCNSCTCCDRHQHNKPYKFEPYYNHKSSRETLIQNNCDCSCEHDARQICDITNYHLLSSAPDACDLPMPPLKWNKKNTHEPDYDLTLLDEATHEALDQYWKGRVKACQYAIFHTC